MDFHLVLVCACLLALANGRSAPSGPGFLNCGFNLTATCDDHMELFVDGNRLATSDSWKITSHVHVPAYSRVIEIRCTDTWIHGGILASSDNGLITDGEWICSSDDGNSWTPAYEIGENGVTSPGISAAAKWIWTDRHTWKHTVQQRHTNAICMIQLVTSKCPEPTTLRPTTTPAPPPPEPTPGVYTLTATCDDKMKLFVDGNLMATSNNWRYTSQVVIPENTQIIEIHCVDTGIVGGILASSDTGLLSNGAWNCSSDNGHTWNPAYEIGPNGRGVPGISPEARWIWDGKCVEDWTWKYAGRKHQNNIICLIHLGSDDGKWSAWNQFTQFNDILGDFPQDLSDNLSDKLPVGEAGDCSDRMERKGTSWGSVTKTIGATLNIKLSMDLKPGRNGFEIKLQTDVKLSDFVIWSMDVKSHSDRSVTLIPKAWFPGKKVGDVLDYYFQMVWLSSDSLDSPKFTSMTINGYDVCSSGPVNGGWTVFGTCSVSCGGGTETRTCTDPPPSNNGDDCTGRKVQACNSAQCPGTNPLTDSPILMTAAPNIPQGDCTESMVMKSKIWGSDTKTMQATLKIKLSDDLKSGEDGFKIKLQTDINLTNFVFWWGVKLTPSSGNSFTITPISSFQGKKLGDILEYSFQISWRSSDSSDSPKFTSLTINGHNVCGSGNKPPTNGLNKPPTNGLSGDYKIVCYFTNWASYFTPEDIDINICTHIVYAFAVLDKNKLLIKSTEPDFYRKVTKLKEQGIKVSLALGGYRDSMDHTNKYSNLVKDPVKRKLFIDHVITFIEKHNFDGLDLDWEYPSSNDKVNFADWVSELRAAFTEKKFLLSAAVSASKEKIDAGYDVPRIARDLDWIAVMCYDYHGYPWSKKTGHHASLKNADISIQYWITEGAQANKLVLGMPLYGRSFTLADKKNHGLNDDASGGGNKGIATKEKGYLAYHEICRNIKSGWTVVKDSAGPYAYEGNQWVGFDDADTIKQKSRYVRENGLAGGMVWALDLDDFDNLCDEGHYPLMNAMKEVLGPARG